MTLPSDATPITSVGSNATISSTLFNSESTIPASIAVNVLKLVTFLVKSPDEVASPDVELLESDVVEFIISPSPPIVAFFPESTV